jgi:predicted ATP-grasp superfamily ATP-dependent carboligase
MSDVVRILVLDGHSNAGLACVRSLGRAGHTVLVGSHVRQPLGSWSKYCRGRVRYAGHTVGAFRELREYAHREGITVGCGPEEMLLGAFDKARTLRAAQECGLKIPPTQFPESMEECLAAGEAIGYPCVVKPRSSQVWDGAGFRASPGVRYAATPADLQAAVAKCALGGAWPLIQGFVPGHGRGVFALYDRGRPVTWFAQESLRSVRPMASPNCLRRSVPLDRVLQEQADRLLTSLGWHGPAMVELRDDGRTDPWLMEVNGRFWVSLQLAVSAGVDFPRLWVNVLRGERVQGPTSYREGVVLRWLWGDVKRLLGILVSGPPPGYSEPCLRIPGRRPASAFRPCDKPPTSSGNGFGRASLP